MKNKNIRQFWIGFMIAAVISAWLYWLWRQKREVMPKPLVIGEERRKKPAAESSATVPVNDSLEIIRGIGPAYARRLYDSGIKTYAQLAQTTPEAIRPRCRRIRRSTHRHSSPMSTTAPRGNPLPPNTVPIIMKKTRVISGISMPSC